VMGDKHAEHGVALSPTERRFFGIAWPYHVTLGRCRVAIARGDYSMGRGGGTLDVSPLPPNCLIAQLDSSILLNEHIGTMIEGQVGDYVFGPRGIPHRYTVGSAGCRMLFILTPGGFENLVIAMSAPASHRTLPPPMKEEPNWAHVAAIAKANGCDLLG
jgi:hypothetical protein